MANSSDDDLNAVNQLSSRVSWKNAQNSNEKTPKSKQVFSTTIPFNSASTSSGTHSSCSRASQLNLASNSPSFLKTQYSTPKNLMHASKSNSNQTGMSTEYEFSITNPFENQSTIDSLLQPSLSPSIFDPVSKNTSGSAEQSPGSFWNIDQIALMKPTDIDLSKFHEQQNFVKFEPAMELKAQKAIDSFFASGVNITSPWSSSDRPHYLAIISPAVPPSSRKKQSRKQDPVATPSAFPKNFQLVEKEEAHETRKVNAATQTMLSLPFDLDLMKILGKYFCNDGGMKKSTSDLTSGEVLSNSSLRRKLFFHDAEEEPNFDDDFANEKPSKEGIELIGQTGDDIDVFPMQEGSFLTKNKAPFSFSGVKTPLLKAKHSSQKTPSSCQSPFSSSPVTGGRMFDLGTPYRTQDQVKFECFSPGPQYSPIRCVKTVSDIGSEKRLDNTLSNSVLMSCVDSSGDCNAADTTKSFAASSLDA